MLIGTGYVQMQWSISSLGFLGKVHVLYLTVYNNNIYIDTQISCNAD